VSPRELTFAARIAVNHPPPLSRRRYLAADRRRASAHETTGDRWSPAQHDSAAGRSTPGMTTAKDQ
jgi:hypothetical protein